MCVALRYLTNTRIKLITVVDVEVTKDDDVRLVSNPVALHLIVTMMRKQICQHHLALALCLPIQALQAVALVSARVLHRA